MDIAALLEPYIIGLTDVQLAQVSTYLDLLMRWNVKTNLTSIRDPKQIVTRHFGESFFLAARLFGSEGIFQLPNYEITKLHIYDLGSGAGFPAIPLKIALPVITLTLVEAHHTKAVFLREVLRALQLNADVKNVRAESLAPASASLVTLRAVEKFDSILPIAAGLVRWRPQLMWEPEGPISERAETTGERVPSPVQAVLRIADSDQSPAGVTESVHPPRTTLNGLAILISSTQIAQAKKILPNWRFHPQIPIPNSQNRVIQLIEPNQ